MRHHVTLTRIVFAGTAGIVSTAGCTGPDDCTIASASCERLPPLALAFTPSAATLAVGDTTSVAVVVTRGTRPAVPSVRWSLAPGGAAVVAIDSTTITQTRVRVRAAATGLGGLLLSATVGGETVLGGVPITVVAR